MPNGSKNKSRRLIVSTGISVVIVTAFLYVLSPVFLPKRPNWQQIANPEELLLECSHLLFKTVEQKQQDLPFETWPDSIKQLSNFTRDVKVYDDYIQITMWMKHCPTWGYIVYPDKRMKAEMPSEYTTRYVHPGIFEYVIE